MGDNSEIIQTEILRILNESGRTRGSELVKRVIKKVGNEKTVYREISSLVEAGEIERKILSKSHIEYELINLSKSANNQLKSLYGELETYLEELKKFHSQSKQTSIGHHQKIRRVIHFIHIVQSIEGIMKLLSYYPTFKKDKMFPQINRKINDYWENIMEFIICQSEEEFLNDILANIRIIQMNSGNVN